MKRAALRRGRHLAGRPLRPERLTLLSPLLRGRGGGQPSAQRIEALVGSVGLRRRNYEPAILGLHRLADRPWRCRLVEGCGERNILVQEVEVGGVACLDRGDRCSRRQQCGGLYVGDRPIVGANARVLQELRHGDELPHAREGGPPEVVGRFGHWPAAEAPDHFHERLDVGFLVVADAHEVLVGGAAQVAAQPVEDGGAFELPLGELPEPVAVEGVLQVLEGERVVEDVYV